MSTRYADEYGWIWIDGEVGWVPHLPWLAELVARGVACRECESVRPGAAGALREFVCMKPERACWAWSPTFMGDVGVVLHDRVVEALGDLAGRSGLRELPVVTAAGQRVEGFRLVVPDSPLGHIRGDTTSSIKACGTCGRLRYWARPERGRYLLRRYWDGRGGWALISGELYCTPKFFRDRLEGLRHGHKRLRFEASGRFVDEPTDGLPADYEELVRAVRARDLSR